MEHEQSNFLSVPQMSTGVSLFVPGAGDLMEKLQKGPGYILDHIGLNGSLNVMD